MVVSDSRIAVIQRLLDRSFQEFLKSINSSQLHQTLSSLYLSEQEIAFCAKLHPLALDLSHEEFNSQFIKNRQKDPGIWPIRLIPEATLSDNEYFERLAGKKVVIVGPSSSLIGKNQGSFIESCDLVVRINYQWPIESNLQRDLGERVDILYHACNGDFELAKILVPKFSNCQAAWFIPGVQSRELARFCNQNETQTGSLGEIWQEHRELLGTVPNTGLLAVVHLLRSQLASLYMLGFTFYEDPYYPEYQGRAVTEVIREEGKVVSVGPHDLRAQFDYFCKTVRNDQRLNLDERLEELVEGYLGKR